MSRPGVTAAAFGPKADGLGLERQINAMLQGKLNCTGTVTLQDGAATTTLSDPRLSGGSVILFMPVTANAAAEIGAGGMYVSARDKGEATITHANNAQTDRTFGYAAFG